jgi:hypothetical protein
MIPFSCLPHLALAVTALRLAELTEKETVSENFDAELEEWVNKTPLMYDSLGDCRSFLRQLCPLKYNHSCLCRDADYVISFIPKAGTYLASLANLRSKVKFCVDEDHHLFRGRKMTKKGALVSKKAASTITTLLLDGGYTLEKCQDALYIGVSSGFSPIITVLVEASDTTYSKEITKKIVSLLEKAEVTVSRTDDGELVKIVDVSLEKWFAVTINTPTDVTESALSEVIYAIATAIEEALA